MRIPLDYYRILGLPIQATSEQLQQAHRDRMGQVPRREFSEAAMSARRELLDSALALLTEADRRQAYDARFVATTYDPEPPLTSSITGPLSGPFSGPLSGPADAQSPNIDIAESQLIGALLILQELGEYELVLKLGCPYLTSGNASLNSGKLGDPRIALADIVLTVALACLELGREQWQLGRYEEAAEALETGQELLLREGLFAMVRGEIQSDLFKLRPYRILGMLADSEEGTPERQRGLTLLRDMLHERGGVDGSGNDQSGLSIDDFLRFIQQLRDYLTVEEQQTLFEAEARRPSAVASYLAVYALLARGFARQEPALIRRAKMLLTKLGGRQDVYLEQAVCSLLLGQTEAASKSLERSQEYEPLAFIREHSQDAPDLLPGLCLYAERWMQNEVFSHFRDLAPLTASLKDYFSNEQVQAYLEELPVDTEPTPGQWMGTAPRGKLDRPAIAQMASESDASSGASTDRPLRPTRPPASRTQVAGAAALGTTAAASILPSAAPEHPPKRPAPADGLRSADRHRQVPVTSNGHKSSAELESLARSAPQSPPEGPTDSPPQRARPVARPADRPGTRPGTRPRSTRPSWLLPVGIVLLLLLGFLFSRLFRAKGGPDGNAEPLMVQLDQPLLLGLPEDTAPIGAVQGNLTNESAKQIVNLWLTAKTAAMGSTHSIDLLSQVLTEPKLAEWQKNAGDAKTDNWYKEYTHAIDITAVEVAPTDPNQAKIRAKVNERSKYYQGTQLISSQEDDLSLVYLLVRQDNQWRIKDWSNAN